jgi:hypothetical protein
MPFDDRLARAVQAREEAEVRRLLAGAGRAKLAELALTRRLPDWLTVLVRQEQEQRERKEAATDPLAAAIACPTCRRLRNLPEDPDEYSALPLSDLRRRVAPGAREEVAAGWPGTDDETRADVYRWVLRGLPPALACRKVHLSQQRRQPGVAARFSSWRASAQATGVPSRAGEQGSSAVLEAETAEAPAWLGSLAGVLDACLTAPARKGKLDLRVQETEGSWEVLVCPLPAGRSGTAVPFSLDVRRLQAAFGRVDRLCWNARGAEEDGSDLCVEGLFGDREVRLRVLACVRGS